MREVKSEDQMKKGQRYLLFRGCTYRKFNHIDLKKLPLPEGGEWVEVQEFCCGSNFFFMGNTKMADALRDLNLKSFRAASISTVVTPCPHCYSHLRRVYHDYLGHVKILHTVHLLSTTLSYGKLHTLDGKEVVTYHDPCLLGRLAGVYEEPRRILSMIFKPGQMIEMRENRQIAPCCGSGWLVNSTLFMDLAQEIAKKRLQDAERVGATTLVTACPSCQKLFDLIIKEKGVRLKVRDINEAALEAIRYQE
jgi:heterodisulfide reductase subunit D